jgi:hypothetical protein
VAGQQTVQATLIKLMNTACHGIFAVEGHLGNLRHAHGLGRQQNDLAPRLDRGIGSAVIKFLQDLLLFWRHLSHVDFTWPGYDYTSVIVSFRCSFYHVSRKGFTALFSTCGRYKGRQFSKKAQPKMLDEKCPISIPQMSR